MAGCAIYRDLGSALTSQSFSAPHWIQSVRISGPETQKEKYRPFWPKITENAVQVAESAETTKRRRIFVSATTASLEPYRDTSWSSAFDQLAYNSGLGRLFVKSIGNVREWPKEFIDAHPGSNLNHKIEDPAQAANVLTVGAYTKKQLIPPSPDYSGYNPVGSPFGISPYTRCGHADRFIKPDFVVEGGNLGFDGNVPDPTIPTLCTLTTGHDFLTHPLALMFATSGATASAGRIAASVWKENPDLRPETIRGLLVHSCTWTKEMEGQFPDLDDRLAACGYGVPNADFATYCITNRATVVVESEMPNRLEIGQKKNARVAKLFELPVPRDSLLEIADSDVSLRVTLSYFSEPNTVREKTFRGLNLRWDMQGPDEPQVQFEKRINKELRAEHEKTIDSESFPWRIGKQRRSRGTVQSDRWTGRAADLAGSKCVVVYPVSGWWDDRKSTRFESMRFSLIVTVECAGLDLYTPIKNSLDVSVTV